VTALAPNFKITHQHISATVHSARTNAFFVNTFPSNHQAAFTFIRYKFTWESAGRPENLCFKTHYSEIHCALHRNYHFWGWT